MTGENRAMPSPLPPIDAAAPTEYLTATFAAGCFWAPDARFGVIPGVLRTRVGYSGGMGEDPTYYEMKDHTETLQLDYDPGRVSYSELTELFFRIHNPFSKSFSRQYMSTIFYHNGKQREIAISIKNGLAAEKGEVFTGMYPLDRFYQAENYHQKYHLQQSRLFIKEFRTIYPDFTGIVNSTAGARVNGFLAGYGARETLKAEVADYGLSDLASSRLLDASRAGAC